MSIGEFWNALQRRRLLVAVFFLLPLLVAVAFTLTHEKTYDATAQAFVTTPSSLAAPDQALAGSQFAENRAESYALLARTETVTGPVVTSLGLPLTPRQLAEEISTSVTLDTVVIDITVTDSSARRAADIANAVGRQLVIAVNGLEAETGVQSPVVVTLVQPATTPTSTTGPSWLLSLGLGLVAGVALAVCAALVAESVASARGRALATTSVTLPAGPPSFPDGDVNGPREVGVGRRS
ncbi:MAG: YveK family protein [Janthinobacterium lividum]